MNAGTRPLGVTLFVALASSLWLAPSRCEASPRYTFTDLGRLTGERPIFTPDGRVDTYSASFEGPTRVSDGGYSFDLVHLDRGIQRTYASFDGGTPVPIPTLNVGPNTFMSSVNESGVFVGMNSAWDRKPQDGRAISFTMDGGPKSIAVPYGDDRVITSMASGINDKNQIVGSYIHNYFDYGGFLTEGDSTWDLNTLVDTNNSFLLTGASDINNSGQILALAYDLQDSKIHDVLLTPMAEPVPEPSTFLLVAAGVTVAVFRMKALHACDRTAS